MMLPKRPSLRSEHSSKFMTVVICDQCYDKDANITTKTNIQDGSEALITTKVPAKKGKTLYDTLQNVLERYELSCETHSLFLGAYPNITLVPYTHDAYVYREQTLYVRASPKCHDVPFTRSRNESKKSIASNAKRFSQLLSEFDLVEDEIDGEETSSQSEFYLESSWKDVIMETEDMTKRTKLQQEGVWELLTSEVGYIEDLKVVIDVFKRCFTMLQKASYLKEIDQKLIFANIEQIYKVNLTFWRKLKLVVDQAKITKEPIFPSHLSEAFSDFENLFQPYIEFCNTDTSNLKSFDLTTSTNDLLKKYLEWCNNHRLCKRLTLQGFLIKPLQRVTKYSLLLKAIMNKTDDTQEHDVAEKIMCRVETFVSKINSSVHLRQEMEKIGSVIARISDYNPVEMFTEESEKILAEYCHLDLRKNIPYLGGEKSRAVLKEGHMKLVEKQGKKEIYVFLFSDCLIITKQKKHTDKYRIIRPPFCLDKIAIHSLKDPGQLLIVNLNRFGVVSTACIVQTGVGEQEMWKMVIEKARDNYENMRRDFALRQDELETDNFNEEDQILTDLRTSVTVVQDLPFDTTFPLEEVAVSDTEMVNPCTPCNYEWDNTLLLVFVLSFILFNYYFYRGLNWLASFL